MAIKFDTLVQIVSTNKETAFYDGALGNAVDQLENGRVCVRLSNNIKVWFDPSEVKAV